MNEHVQGYAEGYYGRLLDWDERLALLDALAAAGQNVYYYAPKEDARHRLQWRTPYDAQWRSSFASFCDQARSRHISVVAGVAPGLDFNFNDLQGGPDFNLLVAKCRQLLDDGANHVSLLMDDIDADFHTRSAGITSEGEAHARLANALSEALRCAVWVTPRIYANELAEEEPEYLPEFLGRLHSEHRLLYCGSDVVARQASIESLADVSNHTSHAQVLWDNLYANDYCPRRLFIGPWTGRDSAASLVLNATGLVNTDCLLLDMMASYQTTASRTTQTDSGNADTAVDTELLWRNVLERHGVPSAFFTVARFFWHPVFNDSCDEGEQTFTQGMIEAIDECLWRWKSPLSREWYPYLFGLKHDLLVYNNSLPRQRILKTQNQPLASCLLSHLD
ncbi:MAG: beta-N-acetylglucosaminidase domain-containing protein [Granulosicoccus sp.]